MLWLSSYCLRSKWSKKGVNVCCTFLYFLWQHLFVFLTFDWTLFYPAPWSDVNPATCSGCSSFNDATPMGQQDKHLPYFQDQFTKTLKSYTYKQHLKKLLVISTCRTQLHKAWPLIVVQVWLLSDGIIKSAKQNLIAATLIREKSRIGIRGTAEKDK